MLKEEIDAYVNRKRYRQINSILLYEKGEIVAECYYNGFTPESRNVIRSIGKSITSILVGLCLDKGFIKSLDDPIAKYIPLFAENRHPYHKLIKVRHLLTMSSGIYWVGGVHYHCPLLRQLRMSDNWLAYIADVACSDVPGMRYNYKEWDVLLLAHVIEQACGEDLYDFLNRELYQPLGIVSGRWWKSPCGTTYSVAGGDNEAEERTSNLSARDLLKIGQLFLNGGVYEGKQILSNNYIQQAITPSKENPGYGYMWWIGEGWYGCHGYGGQNVTVMPDKQKIYVMQATPTLRAMEYEDMVSYVLEEDIHWMDRRR
ncbi:serine hydrolase domain-containing protein [Anaerosporobacter faecicola]|uniref:serine hydrolase domain-containing protein n=1 Tax=Anaerosporobacter faecicola TaxID=2718714 RepID=UPI00143ADD65|nr:serine hydrolase [Anaerosporobacter faecicola]